LAPGTKEDTASCREFFHDLRRRGLPDPLLVASDGAPGMIRAIEECLPRSIRQRCLAHKMRNLQSKMPEDVWPEFRGARRQHLPHLFQLCSRRRGIVDDLHCGREHVAAPVGSYGWDGGLGTHGGRIPANTWLGSC
jgi:hypothetical protein